MASATVIDKFINIILFIGIFVAAAPLVIVYLGNISNLGIPLVSLLAASSVGGILLAAFGISYIVKMLKTGGR